MSDNRVPAIFGEELLKSPRFNKGTAFSKEEREAFALQGMLPPRIESMAEQAKRAYSQYEQREGDLNKNLFLQDLHNTNTTLFYRLVNDHLAEMLPIIYTPTIGEAVMTYSSNFLRPQGLIISYKDYDRIPQILEAFKPEDIDIAVVTDGEGVLGIGDQGIGGLNIAIGKLMVYTTCGGINPFRTLPIQLDVGTNNKTLLAAPFYLGLREPRIGEKEYYRFVDRFVECFKQRFPNTFLHWEDFGKSNARRVLDRYRDVQQSFNDDIQGTGAITLAAVLTGIQKSGLSFADHRFCIFGAGTAGCGIADQISQALAYLEQKDVREIRRRFYLLDRQGLLREGQDEHADYQKPYIKSAEQIKDWKRANDNEYLLEDVVRNAKITVLIGCSTVSGAFSAEILSLMRQNSCKPVIMPLSNPTSKAEATPEQILRATQGNALIATGSPFKDVEFNNSSIRISQCNNALVYPGIALGMLLSKASRLSETMLLTASKAISDSYANDKSENGLLPDLSDIQQLSANIGFAVARQAMLEKLCPTISDAELNSRYQELVWQPVYYDYCDI